MFVAGCDWDRGPAAAGKAGEGAEHCLQECRQDLYQVEEEDNTKIDGNDNEMLANLRYIVIYQNLDFCYDQMVHPQKRWCCSHFVSDSLLNFHLSREKAAAAEAAGLDHREDHRAQARARQPWLHRVQLHWRCLGRDEGKNTIVLKRVLNWRGETGLGCHVSLKLNTWKCFTNPNRDITLRSRSRPEIKFRFYVFQIYSKT